MARPKKNGGTSAKADFEEAQAAEEARIAADAARAAALVEASALAVKTMTGDLRDLFLNLLRYEQDKRPWDQRGESEQRETVHRVDSAIQEAVKGAVELIAAGGLPTISCTLDHVGVKEGLTLKVLMDRSHPQRHQVVDATGGKILLVMADASAFIGERKPVEIKPDQRDIAEVLAEHSGDQADHAAEIENEMLSVANGDDKKPGWRPERDAFPASASPLN